VTLKLNIRPIQSDDGPALATLLQNSADTGRIGVVPIFENDPYILLTQGNQNKTSFMVAEAPDNSKLAGICGVSFDNRKWNSGVKPHAYFHSLAVDPAYRRQGVATQLSNWLYEEAGSSLGEDAVMSAFIQGGNIGSLRTCIKKQASFLKKEFLYFPQKR